MIRSLGVAATLSLSAICAAAPASAGTIDRTLPMRFELRQQGPADICADRCSIWISASGAITSDTPRDFLKFADGRDLKSATLVLDSDGGSVLGAIALGREVRRLNLSTTVGRVVDVSANEASRVSLSPRADCESMCTFVLLAGVKRHVPAEARVMVHQIWLGDRREDPTAANYSAEDLVLVQRDIGRLARYSADMGAPSELIELALRIPPWEPMHALTRDELVRMKLDNEEPAVASAPPVATSSTTSPSNAVAPSATPVATSGARAEKISDRRWQMVDRSGSSVLARRHPLTVEGDDIGRFDLIVTCAGSNSYGVSYVEQRHNGETRAAMQPVANVSLRAAGMAAALNVVSSERRDTGVIDTFASGTVPAALIKAFTASGPHSLTVVTSGGEVRTVIRIGNTGASQSLPQLSGNCQNSGNRAELVAPKTGAMAAN